MDNVEEEWKECTTWMNCIEHYTNRINEICSFKVRVFRKNGIYKDGRLRYDFKITFDDQVILLNRCDWDQVGAMFWVSYRLLEWEKEQYEREFE